MKDDSFNIFGEFDVEAADITRVKADPKTWKFYLLGYVDYIDKFGDRHRAGYARVYDPLENSEARYTKAGVLDVKAYARRNNLPFVMTPGYNYDRPREKKKGEGNDWDDDPATA